jgi:hypothetical protein
VGEVASEPFMLPVIKGVRFGTIVVCLSILVGLLRGVGTFYLFGETAEIFVAISKLSFLPIFLSVGFAISSCRFAVYSGFL